ncbi:MAG TPA: TolC family protein [Kiritimatiellia bacterium]|nr:TolC family protein [Kiritimatiellia bacterium]
MNLRHSMPAVALLTAFVAAIGRGESRPDRPVLTLTDSIEMGLEQATAARNARRDEAIAGKRIGQVRAQLLPQLKATGRYTRLDEVEAFEFDGDRFEMGREDTYAAGVEASQLLYSGGSVGAALKAARLYLDVARASVQQVENDLVRDIRTAFHGILLADEQVRVQEASVAQLEDLLEQTEARYRRQTAPEFDVLTARVRLANEQPKLIQARKQAELARVAFRNLVRIESEDVDVDGELVFEPEERALEEWQALGRERRPELIELGGLLGMREADIRAEQGGGLPQVRAFAGYRGENPQSGSSRDEWDWGWNAGVAVEWDLFDGLLRRNRVSEKRLELAKARELLEETERQIALEIQTHYLDMREAAETVAASAETVELAEKGLEIARARYENGLATYLDFTDANLALATARLTRLQALHDHMNALARLRQASGEVFERGETP